MLRAIIFLKSHVSHVVFRMNTGILSGTCSAQYLRLCEMGIFYDTSHLHTCTTIIGIIVSRFPINITAT